MKNINKLLGLLLIISISSHNLISQNIVMTSYETDNLKNTKTFNAKNTALKEGLYKYKNMRSEVLVEIKDNTYTEYHPNNEFIKANINWIDKYTYVLTITALNKSSFPHSVGTELITNITKIKGKKILYEATIDNGLSWSGKFIKVK